MQKTLDGSTEKDPDCKVTGAKCSFKRKQITVLKLEKKKKNAQAVAKVGLWQKLKSQRCWVKKKKKKKKRGAEKKK